MSQIKIEMPAGSLLNSYTDICSYVCRKAGYIRIKMFCRKKTAMVGGVRQLYGTKTKRNI